MKEPLLTIQFNDIDIIHIFTYDEWWNEVWSNSSEPFDTNISYTIEPLFDTNDITPEKMQNYQLSIYDIDALLKYPYIKRTIEHDEIKKTWLKTQNEETGTTKR